MPLKESFVVKYALKIRKEYSLNTKLYFMVRYVLVMIVLGATFKKSGISNPLLKSGYD